MRVMALIRATRDSEQGVMPDTALLTSMMDYNEQLARAGVILDGEGLRPSSAGVRVRFDGSERRVVQGPFPTEEVIAGFWLWRVSSMDEAIEWARRCPNPTGVKSEIELRPVFGAEDFGAELTPELREQEARLRGRGMAEA